MNEEQKLKKSIPIADLFKVFLKTIVMGAVGLCFHGFCVLLVMFYISSLKGSGRGDISMIVPVLAFLIGLFTGPFFFGMHGFHRGILAVVRKYEASFGFTDYLVGQLMGLIRAREASLLHSPPAEFMKKLSAKELVLLTIPGFEKVNKPSIQWVGKKATWFFRRKLDQALKELRRSSLLQVSVNGRMDFDALESLLKQKLKDALSQGSKAYLRKHFWICVGLYFLVTYVAPALLFLILLLLVGFLVNVLHPLITRTAH